MKPLFHIIIYFILVYGADSQDIQWQKCIGGSAEDRAFSILLTDDGGYILAGYSFSDDGEAGKNQGRSDIWIVKLDYLGNILWQRSYGGSNWDEAYDIQLTNDGGYIIAGHTFSSDGDIDNNHGESDYWIIKLNSYGEIDWQKQYGGSRIDIANAVLLTGDGGFIVLGYSESTDGDVSGNHGGYDYWVLKLQGNGEIEWENSYGGSEDDFGKAIVETTDGGYLIAGRSESSDGDVSMNYGDNDIWISRIDSYGNLLWENNFGGSEDDYPSSVSRTNDNGFIISGGTKSIDGDITANNGWQDAWAIELDAAGSLVWQKTYGKRNADYFTRIHQSDNGEYIAVGITEMMNENMDTQSDVWIVKLTGTGEILSQGTFGGSRRDWAYEIRGTTDGGYITAGFTYSNDGDVSGNNGVYDIWIVKFAGNREIPEITDFIIYPSIADDKIYIEYKGASINLLTSIYSITGQKLIEQPLNREHLEIDLRSLPIGIYFIRINTSNGPIVRKFIKR